MVQYIVDHPLALGLILLWSLPWKAVALWKSARRGHAVWFLVILIVNTLGILEMAYLLVTRRREPADAHAEQLPSKKMMIM